MEHRDWLEGTGITGVEWGRWTRGTGDAERNVVGVTLRGAYGPERQSQPSRVLRMSIAAVLRWEARPPHAVLLDVSQLEYFGGDTLVNWTDLLEDEETRVSYLCSPANAPHVKSLLDEYGDEERFGAFSTLTEALDFAFAR